MSRSKKFQVGSLAALHSETEKAKKKRLENTFLATWRLVGRENWGDDCYPEPEREFYFYRPHRQWRFDFAWPECLVAVEIEGGIFNQGRHGRGAGIAEDAVKYNAAAFIGWAVIRITPPELRAAPIPTLEEIARLIHRRTVDSPRAYPLNSYALKPLSEPRSRTTRKGAGPQRLSRPLPLLDATDDDRPPF